MTTKEEEKEWLFGKTLSELETLATEMGGKRYVGRQIAEWLYVKRITDIEGMTNLSKSMRERLQQKYVVGRIGYETVQQSVDGTRKYLFPTLGGAAIESAYIPDGQRATLCISSQSGCRMGCRFCMTARQGFLHNLSSGEILNQICSIEESERLTNVVYMGMGEPLDNLEQVLRSLEILTAPWGFGWSPTRITLSTVGVLPSLVRFMRESKVHLAISLHNPFGAERQQIMPVQNKYGLEEVVKELKNYDWGGQRRISFEYILFEGINDTERHIKGLCRLLKGLRCRVNLIRFHRIPDTALSPSSMERIEFFKDAMNREGIITTLRASRGEDIFAACGMLSTKNKHINA